jgi:hypothetical protein
MKVKGRGLYRRLTPNSAAAGLLITDNKQSRLPAVCWSDWLCRSQKEHNEDAD